MERYQITIKQLECLVALERTAHFRQAAELLKIQQPSLSQQIQNLEEILNVKLVERSRGGVALTPTGRGVFKRAQEVLASLQNIEDFAVSAKSELTGTLRLGTTPTLGPYFLPFVVKNLHKSHKALDLYVRERGARDLEFELAQGEHDFILTQMSTPSKDHHTELLFQEPLYLAMAVDHPLAKKVDISTKDLAGLSVLGMSPSYHLYDQVKRLCDDYNAELLRDYEGTSLDALRHMVGMDMGVTFLPALYVHSEIRSRSEIVVKRITGRNISRSIGLIWRKRTGHGQTYDKIANVMRDIAGAKFKDLIDLS